MMSDSLERRVSQKSKDEKTSTSPERVDLPAWQKEVLGVFDKMKTHTQPYEIQAGEFSLVVLPNVFSPKYFTDSLWFAEMLPKIVGQKSLLEVGSGTGIISLYCANNGATVEATDINPDASRNTKINAARNHLPIKVYNGDMFASIPQEKKYDFIFWNHPFNNWDRPVDEMLLRAGLDQHYAGLENYVRGARQFLTDEGGLLLGTGDMADTKAIERIASENNYKLQLLEEAELPLEEGGTVMNSYRIYRFDKI